MWRIHRPDAAAIFEDKPAQRSLGRYFSVLQNIRNAKFINAKKISAEWRENDSMEELWREHARCNSEFQSWEKAEEEGKFIDELCPPKKSYLDLKIAISKRILQKCHFCARRCGVDRMRNQLGYCSCGSAMKVSSIFAHIGEEPELVPSGTIFTMGCTICCLHCQNWAISQWKEDGIYYGSKELADIIENLYTNGCRNANLVGGEPTPWVSQWLETFNHVKINVPIIWNSNSYYSQETGKLLSGFVDVYLLDFKYGPEECASRISDAPLYWDVCTRNHLEAKKYGELIIRVLVLPGHVDCCTAPILHWISKNLGKATRLNLMFQYRPEWRANEIPELRRKLTKEEMSRASSLAEREGLTNLAS